MMADAAEQLVPIGYVEALVVTDVTDRRRLVIRKCTGHAKGRALWQNLTVPERFVRAFADLARPALDEITDFQRRASC